jgi:hypothetical protein
MSIVLVSLLLTGTNLKGGLHMIKRDRGIFDLNQLLKPLSRRILGLAGKSKYQPHQGNREKSTRLLQIEKGFIKKY